MKWKISKICKTLIKKIEDNTSKWGDIPCSRTGRINIKMSIFSEQSKD